MRMNRLNFRLLRPFLISSALILSSTVASYSACTISVGEGVSSNRQLAERRAIADARQKIGRAVPSNANYSEPACFIYEDGSNRYGCRVEVSYCTNPAAPTVGTPPPAPPKFVRHRPNYHVPPVWSGNRSGSRHSTWNKHHHKHFIRFRAGGYHKQKKVLSCLRFNSNATAFSLHKATALVNTAVDRALRSNVGVPLNSNRVQSGEPACYFLDDGSSKVNCSLSVRYCY